MPDPCASWPRRPACPPPSWIRLQAADRTRHKDPALRIDLLGPLTLRVHGRAVDLEPPMQRRLLGLLALQANRIVTHTEIVDFLWGQEIPDTYLNLVHTHVSRLRRFFDGVGAGQELISRTGAGYRLTLTSGQSDLLTFTDMAAKATAHHVAGEFEEAERVYREHCHCGGGRRWPTSLRMRSTTRSPSPCPSNASPPSWTTPIWPWTAATTRPR